MKAKSNNYRGKVYKITGDYEDDKKRNNCRN